MNTTNSAGWDAGTSMHPAIGDEPEHDPFALDDEIAHIDRGGDVAGWTPAFPFVEPATECSVSKGMSLRDYFAAKALEGLCANPGGPFQANGMSGWGIVNCTVDHVAQEAYGLADAMLKARNA